MKLEERTKVFEMLAMPNRKQKEMMDELEESKIASKIENNRRSIRLEEEITALKKVLTKLAQKEEKDALILLRGQTVSVLEERIRIFLCWFR